MIKAFGPKRSKGFRDKYLAPIMIAAAFLINAGAHAQVDTNKVRQQINAYGYDYQNVKVKGSLIPPTDTFKLKQSDSGAIAVVNKKQYVWNGSYWQVIAGDGGTATVTTKNPITKVDDSVALNIDTTALAVKGNKLISKIPVFRKRFDFRQIATADLDSNFVYKIRNGDEFSYDPNDNSTPDDTAITIVTPDGKRLKRIINGIIYVDWWYRDEDGEDDGPSFQRMFDWMADNGGYKFTGKKSVYKIYTRVVFPDAIYGVTNHKFIEFDGYGKIIQCYADGANFYRQSEDFNASLDSYKLLWKGVSMIGTDDDGQKALEFGSTTGSVIADCHFQDFDTAVVARFWLEGLIWHNFFSSNKSVGILCSSYAGMVDGANVANTAFNANLIGGWNRFYQPTGAFAAIVVQGADQFSIIDNVIEGNKGEWDIYIDFDGSPVSNILTIENIWHETLGSPNTLYYLRTSGQTYLRRIQTTEPDTLFYVPGNCGDGAIFNFEDIPFAGNMAAQPFNANGDILTGRVFNFKNFGVPSTNASPLLSSKWVGGVTPAVVNVEGSLGANAGKFYFSTADITIGGNYNRPFHQRYWNSRGSIVFPDDNEYELGMLGAVNARPKNIGVGTALYIDNSGRIKWGSATEAADVTIGRDSVGQVGIYNNSSDPANLKLARGIFTQRTGYAGVFSLEDLNDDDFITRKMLEDKVGSIVIPSVNIGFGLKRDIPSAPIEVDTAVISTKYHSQYLIDSLASTAIGGGLSEVLHDSTMTGTGANPDSLRVNLNIVAGRAEVYNSIDSLANTVTNPDGSETKLIANAGYTVAGTGTLADPYILTLTGSPGSNPLQAVSLANYGFAANATVGAGSYATGTNNTPVLQNVINTVPDNTIIIVPPDGLFSTPLDTIGSSKTIQVWFLGKHYQAGNKLFIFKHTGGAFKQHRIWHMGEATDRINLPTHSKATHDAGTQPNWGAMTGVFVTYLNISQINVEMNRVVGFKTPVEALAGYADGSQENTIKVRVCRNCAVGAWQQSLDGNSYNDKTKFYFDRFSGGLAIKNDGYSPSAAVNGEVYNGAFRSNEYHMMIEQVDSIADVLGDVTYPEFKITVEGGPFTGVFGTGIRMRSISPNYVYNPKFTGQGYFEWKHINGTGQNGMGINGWIDKPIWNGGANLGHRAIIDNAGRIGCIAPANLSKTNRDAAGGNFYFISPFEKEIDTTITASSYTLGSNVKHLRYNNASGTLTIPAASSNVDRIVFISNIHGSATLNVSNVSDLTTLAAGQKQIIKSDGSAWRTLINLTGTGEGSSTDSFWTKAANNIDIYRFSKIGIKKNTPTANIHVLGSVPGTANSAPIKIDEGILNTPENGAIERSPYAFFGTVQNTRKEFLMLPDAGRSAGDIVAVNAGNTELIYRKEKSRLIYVQTESFLISNTTNTSLFPGGAKSFTSQNLQANDELEIEGGGAVSTTISGTNSITFTINLGGSNGTLTVTPANNITADGYSWKLKVIPLTTSTSSTVLCHFTVDFPGYIADANKSFVLTGFNCTSPTVNVSAQWSASSNTLNPTISDVKVFQQ